MRSHFPRLAMYDLVRPAPARSAHCHGRPAFQGAQSRSRGMMMHLQRSVHVQRRPGSGEGLESSSREP